MLGANTCSTCKYWEREHSICHKGRKFVDVPNDKRPFAPDSIRVSVYPSVGEFVANVFTGPDFGCIHHKPGDGP